MDTNVDRLTRFIENIKTANLWKRIFGWSTIKTQLVDAVSDLQKLITVQATTADQLIQQRVGLAAAGQATDDLLRRKQEIDLELALARKEAERLGLDLQYAREQVVELELLEQTRHDDHAKMAATLKAIQDKIQSDREAEEKENQAKVVERLEKLKFTWSNHQQAVKQAIKTICQKHTIEYVGRVAFKGDPDNTVKIADEFIVFDAKSPSGDDLNNFPHYINQQSEKAKKYAGEDHVKKWIFFVVPANTLNALNTYVYYLADYHVFVVTIDALEPILLSLKKIEEYEFADQLSPEDRENICRILGKFAHLSKRRIQVDTYFIHQFMELARKFENDLPAGILHEAIEFETAEKLNPPVEKRAKAISMIDLEQAANKIRNDAANNGILLPGEQLSSSLNTIPLYIEK